MGISAVAPAIPQAEARQPPICPKDTRAIMYTLVTITEIQKVPTNETSPNALDVDKRGNNDGLACRGERTDGSIFYIDNHVHSSAQVGRRGRT